MTDSSLFKLRIPIQMRFGDTDALGHVNNAVYLNYMEVGRLQYVAQVFGSSLDWKKVGFILANVGIDFLKPMFLEDKIEIGVRISKVGAKSMVMDYIFIDDNNVIKAKGTSILVAFDYTSNHSISVPDMWKNKINSWEVSADISHTL